MVYFITFSTVTLISHSIVIKLWGCVPGYKLYKAIRCEQLEVLDLESHSGGIVERSPHKRKVGCSNPIRDRHRSLNQAVTAFLPNAVQSV